MFLPLNGYFILYSCPDDAKLVGMPAAASAFNIQYSKI